MQVEVLSAPSTQEDASYVKYLFAEASSQNRIRKGLLGEQKEFLEKVTSFQLEGILYNDIMYNKNTSWESIKEVPLQYTGIRLGEMTYQTKHRTMVTDCRRGKV